MAIRIEVPEDNASLTEFVQFHDRVFTSIAVCGIADSGEISNSPHTYMDRSRAQD